MKDKYYIPEIEELYVGLECEIKEPNQIKPEWEKITLNKGDINGFFYYKTLSKNDIRIKYLDQEDIKSCGWEFKYKEDHNPNICFTKKCEDKFGNGDDMVDIVLNPNNHHVLIAIGSDETTFEDYKTIFSGFIKNKSKLKMIIEMLNIK